jgi:ADP-ribosylglycohydrolase
MMLAKAIDTGADADTLYQDLLQWSVELKVEYALQKVIEQALFMPPSDYTTPIKPVLCAFHNAIWQMLYAKNVEEAIVETIRHGGDTGTNAAIAAALVAAVLGMPASSEAWIVVFEQCKPQEGVTGVEQPRPQTLWPQDLLQLAEQLICPPAPTN